MFRLVLETRGFRLNILKSSKRGMRDAKGTITNVKTAGRIPCTHISIKNTKQYDKFLRLHMN